MRWPRWLLRRDSAVLHATAFVGHPIVAMLLGVLFAQVALRPGTPAALRKTLGDSVKPVAGVLLIIAGGGAFQQVLTDAHVGDAIVHMSQQLALSPLLLGWLISMLLSVSTGSATVGVVGAAGLLAPLGSAEPTLNLPLLALSIGCGSLFFQLRQPCRLLAGEGILRDEHGRGHQDDLGGAIHRGAGGPGHGAAAEPAAALGVTRGDGLAASAVARRQRRQAQGPVTIGNAVACTDGHRAPSIIAR